MNNSLVAEDRILDVTTLTNLAGNVDLQTTFNTLSGIFNFITSNMDVLTAIGLVKHLENRASYDPRQENGCFNVILMNIYLQIPRKLSGLPEKQCLVLVRLFFFRCHSHSLGFRAFLKCFFFNVTPQQILCFQSHPSVNHKIDKNDSNVDLVYQFYVHLNKEILNALE